MPADERAFPPSAVGGRGDRSELCVAAEPIEKFIRVERIQKIFALFFHCVDGIWVCQDDRAKLCK